MLGNIIVRFMSVILNLAGVLLIIGGTVAGYTYGEQHDSAALGAIAGFLASFLFLAITFGVAFLALEINNNLIRIRDALEKK